MHLASKWPKNENIVDVEERLQFWTEKNRNSIIFSWEGHYKFIIFQLNLITRKLLVGQIRISMPLFIFTIPLRYTLHLKHKLEISLIWKTHKYALKNLSKAKEKLKQFTSFPKICSCYSSLLPYLHTYLNSISTPSVHE